MTCPRISGRSAVSGTASIRDARHPYETRVFPQRTATTQKIEETLIETEPDQYVDITALSLLFTGIRIEEGDAIDVILSLEFILQGPEDLKDFGAGLYVRRTSSMSHFTAGSP